MGARLGTCHDTCLRLAGAGYLAGSRADRAALPARYALRIGLTRYGAGLRYIQGPEAKATQTVGKSVTVQPLV